MAEAHKSGETTFVVGRDAGRLGSWLRLIVGVLLLVGITWDVIIDAPPPGLYGVTAMYFVAVTGVYTLIYNFLGEGYFARTNAWINTLILVGPPVAVFILDLGPEAFQLALALYVGVSFVANFFAGYGGCEVVGLPALILRRKYTVYCPMNAVDVVDKAIAERKARDT